MKVGLRNSDGWMPKIQRRAPFTSCPKNSVATTRPSETTKPISAARPHHPRRQEGGAEHHRNRRKEGQRLAVDEMERMQMQALGHRRAAGHGENEPATISMAMLATSQRSMVQAQSEKGVRLARENRLIAPLLP